MSLDLDALFGTVPSSPAPARARGCDVPDCDADAADRYLVGWRCLEHSPAAVAGRVIPTPDPDSTVAGRSSDPRAWATVPYGSATTDPLGRSIDRDLAGARFTDRLPRHPCDRCDPRTRNVRGHKGDHV